MTIERYKNVLLFKVSNQTRFMLGIGWVMRFNWAANDTAWAACIGPFSACYITRF